MSRGRSARGYGREVDGEPAHLTVAALLVGALRELCDPEDVPMPHLVELHGRPEEGVFRAAASRLVSPVSSERALGAWILRELGPPGCDGRRPFSDRAIPLLMEALRRENDPWVERSLLRALAFNRAAEALPEFLARVSHADAGVRETVAFHLPSVLGPGPVGHDAAEAFVTLAADPEPDVRYYAVDAVAEDGVDVGDGPRERIRCRAAADSDEQIRDLARKLQKPLREDADHDGSMP